MSIVIVLFTLSIAVELLLFTRLLWQRLPVRNTLGVIAVGLNSCLLGMLIMAELRIFFVIACSLIIYKIISLYRVLKGRMEALYLYYVTRRTSLVLGVALGATLGMGIYGPSVELRDAVIPAVIVQAVAGIVLLIGTIRTLQRTKIPGDTMSYAASELPAVTVAVPARNETDDLIACLDSIIASDYPKLEVLVLDDCSQNKRTPEIIRGYAHDGVRFLKGNVPPESWLAKNYAYERLSAEASGEVLLFCGVDIRLEADAIRLLISEMLSRNKRMVSLLPLRTNAGSLYFSLAQTVRYLWELAPPRRFFNRPPVLSSCWLIYKNELVRHGGFAAVKKTVTPEAYFAKKALAEDGYSFMRASSDTGLTSVKRRDAQRATAIRVRYPSLKRQLETVVGTTVAELFVCAGPLVVLGYAIAAADLFIAVLALIALVGVYASYALVATNTRMISSLLQPVMFIPAILTDIVLMHISFYRYEFSEVIWKGRNVCVPVMHVTSRLPNVDEVTSKQKAYRGSVQS